MIPLVASLTAPIPVETYSPPLDRPAVARQAVELSPQPDMRKADINSYWHIWEHMSKMIYKSACIPHRSQALEAAFQDSSHPQL
jgi:hypothetical protein